MNRNGRISNWSRRWSSTANTIRVDLWTQDLTVRENRVACRLIFPMKIIIFPLKTPTDTPRWNKLSAKSKRELGR